MVCAVCLSMLLSVFLLFCFSPQRPCYNRIVILLKCTFHFIIHFKTIMMKHMFDFINIWHNFIFNYVECSCNIWYVYDKLSIRARTKVVGRKQIYQPAVYNNNFPCVHFAYILYKFWLRWHWVVFKCKLLTWCWKHNRLLQKPQTHRGNFI